MPDGLIILDKPANITSAYALNRIKPLLARGTKLGHAGTLDRFATGILIVLIGKATKQCEQLMNLPKTYEATVKLGATTATDDLNSPEQPTPCAAPVLRDRIEPVLQKFVGDIRQIPPAYSALKVGGRRASDRARDGESLQLKPRPVRIDSIDLLGFDWPLLRLRIDCGRGTYIRSLARDIGEMLSVGGYLTELRRTRIGPFDLARSATIERLQNDGVDPHLIDAATIPK